MISFNNFIHKFNLNNKAASNIKNDQVFSSLGLRDVGIYLGVGTFSSDTRIVKLHPSKKTHSFGYKNENYLVLLPINYLNSL